jgi:hypothetical protein
MYCENRCGEKVLKMLLLEGWNERDGDNSGREKLLRDVTSLVNTNILGTQNHPANWRIITAGTSGGKKTLGDRSMPNRHVRKFIDKIDLLADLIINDEELLLLWKIQFWICPKSWQGHVNAKIFQMRILLNFQICVIFSLKNGSA